MTDRVIPYGWMRPDARHIGNREVRSASNDVLLIQHWACCMERLVHQARIWSFVIVAQLRVVTPSPSTLATASNSRPASIPSGHQR